MKKNFDRVDIFLGFWRADDEDEGTEEEGRHQCDHSPPELEVRPQVRHHPHSIKCHFPNTFTKGNRNLSNYVPLIGLEIFTN